MVIIDSYNSIYIGEGIICLIIPFHILFSHYLELGNILIKKSFFYINCYSIIILFITLLFLQLHLPLLLKHFL
jgi:hypothetical protein